jgi:proton-translocating NADH-quinone oxidoreductase chain N
VYKLVVDVYNDLLPAMPIFILVIGAVVTYASGRLNQLAGVPELTGVVSFVICAVALLPFYQMYMNLVYGNYETVCYFIGEQVYLRASGIGILLGVIGVFLGLLVSLFSIVYMSRKSGLDKYYPLLLLMIAGIVGIGLAGDLFNLFVFFELMAIASYGLVAFEKEEWEPVEAGMKYVIMSAAGSIAALLGIGIIFMYSGGEEVAGTLDLALLPERLAGVDLTTLTMAAGLIILGFGVKAAIVPMHTWLPDAHSAAPSGISAMLSGIVIQSGLIAMIKTLTIFPAPYLSPEVGLHAGFIIAVFAVITMTAGNLMAMPQTDLKRMLAYSSIAQMGYILLGIGLGLEYGVRMGFTGGLFHIINHAFMKGGAFLCAGAILYMIGTRDLNAMRGIGRRMPVVGISFAVFALALSGMPPFCGFISELFICKGGIDAYTAPNGTILGLVFIIILIANSVLSLGYYVPAINTILLSKETSGLVRQAKPAPPLILIPILIMVLCVVFLGIFPELGLKLVNPGVDFLLGVLGGA